MSYERRKTIPNFFLLLQKIPLAQAMVVGGAILVTFVFWTLPSWGIIGPNLPQLPGLWQNPTNRLILVILAIKVVSPALVGLLLTTGICLFPSIKPIHPSLQQHAPAPETFPITRAPLRVVKISLPQEFPTRRSMAAGAPLTEVKPPLQQDDQQQSDSIISLPLTLKADPITPLPPMHHDTFSLVHEHREVVQEVQDNAASPLSLEMLDGHASVPEETSSDLKAVAEEGVQKSLPVPLENEQRPYTVEIWLLKRPRMAIKTAQGSYNVPLTANAKRVQLLAYIAWRRGEPVDRVRMLEQVFGHGRADEDSTLDKLGETFDSHKKLLRRNLRETIQQINAQAGAEIIPANLDMFEHGEKNESQYWISQVCQIVDLEEIEAQHAMIEQAQKDKRIDEQSVFASLFNEDRKKNTLPAIPEDVKAACDRLIQAYSGDFLEDVIQNYLDDFDPWTSNWARMPYTLFRDYYFQALWYAAEYELRQSVLCSSEQDTQQHWEQAAGHYRTYALRACTSRIDTKVTFGGEHGERVRMSERALRRMLVLYGALGATHVIDQTYTAYYKQMRSISAKAWQPSPDTRADYRVAKKQTSEYRFSNLSDASLLEEGEREEEALEATD